MMLRWPSRGIHFRIGKRVFPYHGRVCPWGGGGIPGKSADPARVEFTDLDMSPLRGCVRDLQPITVLSVAQTPWEPVWNHLMRRYHYLGFGKLAGMQLKHLAFSGERPIAAAAWRAATLKLGPRDRFIGWSEAHRRLHLPRLANNSRLLLCPWLQVPHAASHLLAHFMQAAYRDWPAKYGHDLVLLETFVDPQRFRGTVYRAANWIQLGATQGFTVVQGAYRYHGHPKEVYVYPVRSNFKALLTSGSPPPRWLERPPTLREGDLPAMMLQSNDWYPGLLADCGITAEAIDDLVDLLVDFHNFFAPAFSRRDQLALGTVYLKGLLSDLKRKSVEPMALRYLGTSHIRALQRFMTSSPWHHEQLERSYQQRLASVLAAEDGILTVDSSEFPKQGKESVGVARQYCGRLGKVENCQSGIFVGYTSAQGYGLISAQLYMPKPWFDEEYSQRRAACGVPAELTFKTKPAIAGELIQRIQDQGGFPARWVVADATFGNDAAFRDALAPAYYLAQMRATTLVWLEPPSYALPAYSGRGRCPSQPQPTAAPQRLADVAAAPDTVWYPHLIPTAKGPVQVAMARRRVIEARGGLPHQECWLFMRRDADGEVTFYFSNAPSTMPFDELRRVSLLRWPIEQCFKEGKSELGMSHYELRSWKGWHRHLLYVFLAMLFLLELRHRFALKKTVPLPS